MKAKLWLLAVAIAMGSLPVTALMAAGKTAGPPPTDAINAYAEQLQVAPPIRHAHLTLYPIVVEGVAVPDLELTLDEAMEAELLEIRELKPAEVNRVKLVSRAKEPIFAMGGQMLGGAQQDRIVGDDLIVPPGAELTVPVFCVERGRWVGTSQSFSSMGAVAGSAVRKAGQEADQRAVWDNVAAQQERLDAPSETGALRSVQESESIQRKLGPYERALSSLPASVPKARGVVACLGDEILAADLFASRLLFESLWPKLLESYVIDALDRERTGPAPDAVQIRRWLSGVAEADKLPEDTPGDGALYELRGRGLMGSALVYDDAVVHMELFATETPEPNPFNRLEFRRDRLEREEGRDDQTAQEAPAPPGPR